MRTSFVILWGLLLFCMGCSRCKQTEEPLSQILTEQVKIHAESIKVHAKEAEIEEDLHTPPCLLVSVITERDLAFDSTFVHLQVIRSKKFYEELLKYFDPILFELSDSLGVLVLNRKSPVLTPHKKQVPAISKYLLDNEPPRRSHIPLSHVSLYLPIRLSFVNNKLVKVDTVIYTSPLTILGFKIFNKDVPMPVINTVDTVGFK